MARRMYHRGFILKCWKLAKQINNCAKLIEKPRLVLNNFALLAGQNRASTFDRMLAAESGLPFPIGTVLLPRFVTVPQAVSESGRAWYDSLESVPVTIGQPLFVGLRSRDCWNRDPMCDGRKPSKSARASLKSSTNRLVHRVPHRQSIPRPPMLPLTFDNSGSDVGTVSSENAIKNSLGAR